MAITGTPAEDDEATKRHKVIMTIYAALAVQDSIEYHVTGENKPKYERAEDAAIKIYEILGREWPM